jgi:hypothetical protein
MSNNASPPRNETLLEMYHFRESIQSIEQGLTEMMFGLREFQAGVENLRVLFEKIEDLAILNLGTAFHTLEVDESDEERERSESGEMERESVKKGKGASTSGEGDDTVDPVVISC